MAFNAYLVFHKSVRGADFNQGIFGESTSTPDSGQSRYAGEGEKWGTGAIEITEYGFGVTMPITSSRSDGGGATVGRAGFEVFTCSKNIDSATPWLVRFCCTGKNIPAIVLHIFRSGASSSASGAVKYAMVVFQNCVITKVGISGSGEELPKEQLEFNYGLCEYIYRPTDHDTGLPISKRTGDPMSRPSAGEEVIIRFGWSTITNEEKTSLQEFNKYEPHDAVQA